MSNDLSTRRGLARARREAGSWAELARQTGVPVTTLKSRAQRLGIRVNRTIPVTTVAGEPPFGYGERMEEFLMTIGYSGYPAQHAMLEFASELGLDRITMFKLAHKASELAGEEHNRLTGALWDVWNEYGAQKPAAGEDDEQ
jgi:hypothetical protein